MAEDLKFGIYFDLDAAVKKASEDWNGAIGDRLEKAIAKRKFDVKLKLDTTKFDNLDDVRKRLAQLKIEPITPETKTAIRELARELQTLAKALEQVQKYSAGRITASPDAVRAARISEIDKRNADRAAIAHEQARAAAARAEQAEIRLAQARERNIKGVKALTNAYKEQSTYLDHLLKRMVTYWSVQQVQKFLTNIREVTAQFELQRVSLGAIIQDQNRANQLFSEIKSFALKSPVSILDLTKYTKQIAAYGVETEKLFDTTKMLTDVSVGLGTPLSQLALAFGQIRSSSVLRLAETRQLTEAGIPALELLAKQLEETYGRFVSTAEVMELISKRAISFEMVEQMFKDMTSAGGMFYNMQEKQGNTLFGLWAKLGDAASMMYDEIGNTEWVNEGMKDTIQLLTSLMRNWRLVGGELVIIGAAMSIIAAKSKAHATATALQETALNKVRSAGIAYNAIIAQEAKLTATATAAQRASITARKANAKAALDAAIAERAAANSTNVWTRSMQKLKGALAGNWVTLLITAVAALGVAIYDAIGRANRLKNTLNSIDAERLILTSQSVRNFEFLANAAIKAADGSKQQKDALDELHRTYRDMIPIRDLTVEKLRAMHGNYTVLTNAIREYIAEQQKQRKISAIQEQYGAEIQEQYKALREYLTTGKEINVGSRSLRVPIKFELSETEFNRFFNEFEKQAENKAKSLSDKIKDAYIDAGLGELSNDQLQAILKIGRLGELDNSSIENLNKALYGQASAIKGIHEAAAESVGDLGRYKTSIDDITKSVQNFRLVNSKGKGVDRDTFLFQQGQKNFEIKQWADSIKSELEGAGVTIQEGIFNLVDRINESAPTKISTIDFTKLLPMLDTPEVKQKLGNSYETFKNYILSIQKLYEGYVPSDPIVQAVRNSMFAIGNATKGGMTVMQKYLWDGKVSIEEHLKALKASSETLQAELHKYANYIKQYGVLGKAALALRGIDYDALMAEYDGLTKQIQYVQTYVLDTGKSSSGGTKSAKQDPRLQILNEMVQLAEKLNKEYSDWEKKVGSTEALEKVNATYEETVKYAEKVAEDAGIKLPHLETPTNAKELNEYLESVRKVMETAKGLKGGKKAAIELAVKISDNVSAEDQKAIEAKIKALADRISRTKTAREFYDKVLGMTGDINLAAKVSMSIYGDTGFDLQKQLADQIRQYFQNDSIQIEIPVDVITSDNQINYKKLGEFAEQYKTELGEKPYEEIKKIAEQGQKDLAKTYEGYFKDLEKAKTYASQRIELAQTTAAKIRQIRADMASGQTDKAVGESLISGLIDKEMKEAAKLEWDAFKGTPLYTQMFEDLEHTSTSTLEMMRSRLEALSRTWGSALDPTQLKEMQSRMNEITDQLRDRNPWKQLQEAYRQYKDATDSVTLTGAATKAGEASKNYYDTSVAYGADSVQAKAALQELQAREKIVDIIKQITAEQGKQVKGQKALTLAQQKAFDNEQIARGHLEIAAAELKKAEDKATAEGKDPANDPEVKAKREALKLAIEQLDIVELVSNILAQQGKDIAEWRKSIASVANGITQGFQIGADLAKGIADTMEALGGNEDDVQYWNDISTALGDITAGFQGIIDSALSLNVAGIISNAIGVIPNMVKGFVGLFSAGKVRKANKEIKRQQELLDQLEYSYSRLEKAADKAFGAEYINNFKQQQKNLQAQAAAYRKQAEAERSKGKKADKDKIKEYENAYRDTMDEIADMQGQIAAQMFGSDLASAARDFAQAWLDAYKEFGNTADKMSEKFHEMIENMVVESLLAKVMENALRPAFEMIDKMGSQDFYSESFWRNVAATAEQGAKDADYGAQTMMNFLAQAGISMRDLGGEMTGISRDIATASEESINGLAAHMNTVEYYVSEVPGMAANIAAMRVLMEAGATSTLPAATTGWTDWQQQAMDNLNGIRQNTSEILVQCRRSADACNAAADNLRRVIVPRGTKGTHGVQVYLQ